MECAAQWWEEGAQQKNKKKKKKIIQIFSWVCNLKNKKIKKSLFCVRGFKIKWIINERRPFVTCVYFASGSKCGLSTSGELAAGKLVLFIALHSSSLALGNDAVSLTVGQKIQRREEEERVGWDQQKEGKKKRLATASRWTESLKQVGCMWFTVGSAQEKWNIKILNAGHNIVIFSVYFINNNLEYMHDFLFFSTSLPQRLFISIAVQFFSVYLKSSATIV